MRSHIRAGLYGGLALLGGTILYSALAHPPIPSSQLGYGLALSGDTGVHLNADGTIDYFKSDTRKTFKFALHVFAITTAVGFGFVGTAAIELKQYAEQLSPTEATPNNESNV